MMYFLKRVGVNYAVVDSDDGAIDWISFDELRDYVKKDKVHFQGVDPKTMNVTPQKVTLNMALCNWIDGDNVFSRARLITVDASGKFSMVSGTKRYKGVVVDDHMSNLYYLEFNSGVRVRIAGSDARKLIGRHSEDCEEVVKHFNDLAHYKFD